MYISLFESRGDKNAAMRLHGVSLFLLIQVTGVTLTFEEKKRRLLNEIQNFRERKQKTLKPLFILNSNAMKG